MSRAKVWNLWAILPSPRFWRGRLSRTRQDCQWCHFGKRDKTHFPQNGYKTRIAWSQSPCDSLAKRRVKNVLRKDFSAFYAQIQTTPGHYRGNMSYAGLVAEIRLLST